MSNLICLHPGLKRPRSIQHNQKWTFYYFPFIFYCWFKLNRLPTWNVIDFARNVIAVLITTLIDPADCSAGWNLINLTQNSGHLILLHNILLSQTRNRLSQNNIIIKIIFAVVSYNYWWSMANVHTKIENRSRNRNTSILCYHVLQRNHNRAISGLVPNCSKLCYLKIIFTIGP